MDAFTGMNWLRHPRGIIFLWVCWLLYGILDAFMEIDGERHPRGVVSLWVCWVSLGIVDGLYGNEQATPLRNSLGEAYKPTDLLTDLLTY